MANVGHLAEKLLYCDFPHLMHSRRHRYVYWSFPSGGNMILTIHVVSGIGLVQSFSRVPYGVAIYDTNIVVWVLPFGAFTCALNIYAVAAISYKTWYERVRLLTNHTGGLNHTFRESVRLHRSLRTNMKVTGGSCSGVLLVLVESGMVYCLVLVRFMHYILYVCDLSWRLSPNRFWQLFYSLQRATGFTL